MNGEIPIEAMNLAAMRRIEEIPCGETLIDRISDKDWKDEDCSAWDITAGPVDDDHSTSSHSQ